MGNGLAGATHDIWASRDYKGETQFVCASSWDAHIPGSRLRALRGRRTTYQLYDMAKVRRYARKYGCDIPTASFARVRESWPKDGTYSVWDGGYCVARNLDKAGAEQVARSYRHEIRFK